MDLHTDDAEVPILDGRVRRAVALLSEALGIIDELAASPEAGARLDEVIAVVRQIQPSPAASESTEAEEMMS